MFTHGQIQQAHFGQGIGVFWCLSQHLGEGHLGQLVIAAFAVDTANPDQRIITFGRQLKDAQVLVQRLVQVTSLVSHRSHLHRLVGRVALRLHLVEHRIATGVDRTHPIQVRPRTLATREHGDHGQQQADPVHVMDSRTF